MVVVAVVVVVVVAVGGGVGDWVVEVDDGWGRASEVVVVVVEGVVTGG